MVWYNFYIQFQQPLDVTNHSVAREVVTFFTLPPGDYIVVPQTNVPNCDGKFLLRILTDEQSNIWEVNEDNVLFRNVLVEFEESFKYVSFALLLIIIYSVDFFQKLFFFHKNFQNTRNHYLHYLLSLNIKRIILLKFTIRPEDFE